MLDAIDAAYYDPATGHGYLFARDRFVIFDRKRRVVREHGRIAHQLGVDRWIDLPDGFRSGLDAASYLASEREVHLFCGPHFVVYRDDRIVPLTDGRRVRRLGIDGWQLLPRAFHDGIDGVIHDRETDRTFVIRGDRYAIYGHSEVPELLGNLPWVPPALAGGCDAVLGFPPSGRIYWFRGGDYWVSTTNGVGANYPAKLGRPYGRGLPAGKGGGWLGAAHLIGGPLICATTPTTAELWLWAIDRDTALALEVHQDGVRQHHRVRDLGDRLAAYRDPIASLWSGSCIVALEISGLAPARDHALAIVLGDRELDRVAFRTPSQPATSGRVVLAAGSCADMSACNDVPAFRAIAARHPDATILHGDNCYYINLLGESSDSVFKGGWLFADWDDPRRMLLRQLAARNHPDFAPLSRASTVLAIWDDHDFGYNNSSGHDRHRWAGRDASSAVFRTMWNGPYEAADQRSIYHRWRSGPVEVVLTDSRYEKDAAAQVMLGTAQLAWLIDALTTSTAPVKILVLSSQFLYRRKHESYLADAPSEHAAILDAIRRTRGRVLIVTGDVHYCELVRSPLTGPVELLELTSSSLRTGETDDPLVDWQPGSRIWAVQRDAFATITVDVRGWRDDGAVDGELTIEIIGADGQPLEVDGERFATVWRLADGSLQAAQPACGPSASAPHRHSPGNS